MALSMKPNLFHWATSELSQDAFFCWLFSWAAPEYAETNKALHDTAVRFIHQLTEHSISEIKQVSIHRQHKHIDILVEINGQYGILIEDKVHTKEHSKQLERYPKELKDKFDKDHLFLVYLKTGDQSDYQSVVNQNYKAFLRKDILEILNYGIKQGITNAIFIDFYEHLNRLEDAVNSYQALPLDKWDQYSWIGFYMHLQQLLGEGGWGYVPQRDGGFMGFWWCFKQKSVDGIMVEHYLQLQQDKCCIKIRPEIPITISNKSEIKDIRRKTREQMRNLLSQKAQELGMPISLKRSLGNTMTIGVLKTDLRKVRLDGLLKMDGTIREIKKIEKVIF